MTQRWFDRPWLVLVLLFFVLGPFALPLLWRSSGFSRPAKIVLTLATVGLMVVLVVLSLETVHALLAPLDDIR
ncbi:MAG TPA: hypothetical protein VKW76_16915 [Candidatus Binatia bacterium]|nr:hypothetical protein [Candidatus Binatia bacterium]